MQVGTEYALEMTDIATEPRFVLWKHLWLATSLVFSFHFHRNGLCWQRQKLGIGVHLAWSESIKKSLLVFTSILKKSWFDCCKQCFKQFALDEPNTSWEFRGINIISKNDVNKLTIHGKTVSVQQGALSQLGGICFYEWKLAEVMKTSPAWLHVYRIIEPKIITNLTQLLY